MRAGRIAAYLRLPEKPTELVLADRIVLERARSEGWNYVRFFRDRFDTYDQWESMYQAVQRGELLGIVMVSIRDVPSYATSAFLSLVLTRGIRYITVAEELDSWTEHGKNAIEEWVKQSL